MASMASMASVTPEAPQQDPYLWLEEVTDDKALDWVRAHNDPTLAEFGGALFEEMRAEALETPMPAFRT
jgi:prolyl oligopeptidase